MKKNDMYYLVVEAYKDYIKLAYEFRMDESYLNQELMQYGIYEGMRRMYFANYGGFTGCQFKLINWEDVRNVCIKNDWYTRGSLQDYDYLQAIVERRSNIEMPTKEGYILTIVADIFVHSRTIDYTNIYLNISRLFKDAQKA